jgi:hypothetical protein
MPETANSPIELIHELLARKRYSVSETDGSVLKIQDLESGITVRAVLEGEILFLSIVCMVVPRSKITPELMHKMLAADNGISTSHFQLYQVEDGQIAVTLNNFCKLQELGPDDEDDILSCVGFLLADVLHAKDLIGGDLQADGMGS